MDSLKRQVLPGQLAVVATPIGNLDDLSPRAKQVLTEADAVLCEDTRRTARLIAGSLIDRPISGLERFDAHASAGKVATFVARLLAGESLAVVTDAGTPGISDPGALLVAAAREAGVTVVTIPGPSAVMALLSVSGFGETAFAFRGFFPRKDSDRETELKTAAASRQVRVWVWFESPERILKSLQKVAEVSPDARVVAAKELTKLHERIFAGGAEAVSEAIAQEVENSGTRGEWCFAVQFPQAAGDTEFSGTGLPSLNSSEWVKALLCLKDAGVPASESVKHVCRHYDVPRNVVYESAVKIFQKSGEGY
ncbi:MAG: 16S rRNA (cytidine(1402)-2'-O)-methyltransferase [Bdellovibrionales bacterium GWB1_55_8]|nr:MAG: 16S rRNA (cytidine(1402)-2'-O)-methyltransferase [Bdellovibrionales bacterium GWB1_55_8]